MVLGTVYVPRTIHCLVFSCTVFNVFVWSCVMHVPVWSWMILYANVLVLFCIQFYGPKCFWIFLSAAVWSYVVLYVFYGPICNRRVLCLIVWSFPVHFTPVWPIMVPEVLNATEPFCIWACTVLCDPSMVFWYKLLALQLVVVYVVD